MIAYIDMLVILLCNLPPQWGCIWLLWVPRLCAADPTWIPRCVGVRIVRTRRWWYPFLGPSVWWWAYLKRINGVDVDHLPPVQVRVLWLEGSLDKFHLRLVAAYHTDAGGGFKFTIKFKQFHYDPTFSLIVEGGFGLLLWTMWAIHEAYGIASFLTSSNGGMISQSIQYMYHITCCRRSIVMGSLLSMHASCIECWGSRGWSRSIWSSRIDFDCRGFGWRSARRLLQGAAEDHPPGSSSWHPIATEWCWLVRCTWGIMNQILRQLHRWSAHQSVPWIVPTCPSQN